MVKTMRAWLVASVAWTALSVPAVAQDRDPLAAETDGPVTQNTLILPPIINETPAGELLPALPRPGAEAQTSAEAAKAKIRAEADSDEATARQEVAEGDGDEPEVALAAPAPKAAPVKSAPAKVQPALNAQPVLAKAPVSVATHAEAKAAEVPAKTGPSPLEKFTIDRANAPGTVQMAKGPSPAPASKPVMAPPSDPKALQSLDAMPPEPRAWHFVIAAGAAFGSYDVATPRYLGTARPAASINGIIPVLEPNTPRQTGVVAVEDSDEIVVPVVNVTLNTTDWIDPIRLGHGHKYPATTWIQVQAGGFDADFASQIDVFTPAVGDQLLIPGIAAITPGGIDPILGNQVFADARARRLNYRADDEVRFGHLYLGQTTSYGSWDLSGFGGLGVSLRDYNQTFAFDVESRGGAGAPPEGTHFADGQYTTNIESETYSLTLGVKFRTTFHPSHRLALDGYAKASLDIIDSDLSDAYELRRPLLPTLRQNTLASASDTGFGYGAGLGVSYAFTETLGVRLGVDVTSHEQHEAVRNAVNPTLLDLDRTTVVSGTIGLTARF